METQKRIINKFFAKIKRRNRPLERTHDVIFARNFCSVLAISAFFFNLRIENITHDKTPVFFFSITQKVQFVRMFFHLFFRFDNGEEMREKMSFEKERVREEKYGRKDRILSIEYDKIPIRTRARTILCAKAIFLRVPSLQRIILCAPQ